jgi:transposase
MNKRRTFSPEFKADRVLEVISGQRTPAEICREHLLSPQQLSEWKSDFVQNAARLFQRDTQADAAQVRIAELEQLVGRLTLELEAAKKISRLLNRTSASNGRS